MFEDRYGFVEAFLAVKGVEKVFTPLEAFPPWLKPHWFCVLTERLKPLPFKATTFWRLLEP